jgi:putative hydrolase of the HAD superfamily
MIKAIIFDLGNVLFSWQPAKYLEENGFATKNRELILKDVFGSPEWLLLDNGDITLDEAIKRITRKSPLKKDEIRAVFDLRTKILFPLDYNTKLLPGLKKQGFRLYFLSNFPDDIFDEVSRKNTFFRFFDGGEISARARSSKPDEKIFRFLIDRYSLEAAECLFIDDSHHNTGSAEMLGMKVIHLEDPESLKNRLEELLGITLQGS